MLSTKEKVRIRSKALSSTRAFFASHGYLETDVNICRQYTSVDGYIDVFEVQGKGFLHSSPELAMKELLCDGVDNIYFLGHVFRKEENGSMHKCEFTMLEYYRCHTNESEFLEETIDYLSLFLGKKDLQVLSYDDAMDLFVPKKLNEDLSRFSEQERGHYLFSHYVEKHLGQGCYTIINNFPEQEASLAKVVIEDGKKVAKRFEIFVDGVELANGFFELDDATIAEKRFIDANTIRQEQQKAPYPIDRPFLEKLRSGFTKDTYGIAIGFDRLLMLANSINDISDITL